MPKDELRVAKYKNQGHHIRHSEMASGLYECFGLWIAVVVLSILICDEDQAAWDVGGHLRW